jgi:hypothetical protein
MPPYIDLTNKRIGRFIALRPSYERSQKDWICLCDCGTEFIRRQNEIVKGIVYECPNCVFRRSEFYIGGKKFGRLHVLHEYKMEIWNDKSRSNLKKVHRVWFCKCECGTEKWIDQQSISSGHTVSCGCFMSKNNSRWANETLYPRRAKISSKLNPIYMLWIVLNQKCYNSKYSTYKNWGAKGYTVCEKWRNSSEEFTNWMIENKWFNKLTIVCKEGKKEFSPENCFLMSFVEYKKILKKQDDLEKFGIEYKGKRQTMKDWAKEYNINYACLRSRMKKHNYNLDYCLNMKPMGESGQRFYRDDISDNTIKVLYEQGLSYEQIREKIGFKGIAQRLKKLGIHPRPKIRGDSYRYNQIINTLIKEKKSFQEMLESLQKKGKINKYGLKRKLLKIKLKVENFQIIYA